MENDPMTVPVQEKPIRSESIAKLAEALSKAQGIIEGAVKDSNNPFYKSNYADLASVWSSCRKPLSENGLSVIQIPQFDGEMVSVETTLAHSSGEWIAGTLKLRPVKDDPQGIGSSISYARRYALASIVGIYQEDDDANAASGKSANAKNHDSKPSEEKPRAASSKPNASGLTTNENGYAVGTVEKLEPKQAQAKPPEKEGKRYFIFTLQGKKIFCWDPSMFDWLQKSEGKTIEAQVEMKNSYPTLISGRSVNSDLGETKLPF